MCYKYLESISIHIWVQMVWGAGMYFPSWEFVVFGEMWVLLWMLQAGRDSKHQWDITAQEGRREQTDEAPHRNGLFPPHLFVPLVRNQKNAKGGYFLPHHSRAWTGHCPFNSKDRTVVCYQLWRCLPVLGHSAGADTSSASLPRAFRAH